MTMMTMDRVCMYVCMYSRLDLGVGDVGWMDGWMDGWTDGWSLVCLFPLKIYDHVSGRRLGFFGGVCPSRTCVCVCGEQTNKCILPSDDVCNCELTGFASGTGRAEEGGGGGGGRREEGGRGVEGGRRRRRRRPRVVSIGRLFDVDCIHTRPQCPVILQMGTSCQPCDQ